MSDPDDLKAVLAGIDVSRRGFLGTLIRTSAFVAPAVASLSLPTSAFAASQPASSGYPNCTTGCSGPFETLLFPVADTFLRKDSPHTNEGANPRLLVSADYQARSVVAFDPSELADAMMAGGVEKVELWLTIANNHNTWGQSDDDEVMAHPLDTAFVEGNGMQALLPGSQSERGTGPGATWASPDDPEVMNRRAGRHTPKWHGGSPRRATAEGVIHTNQMVGDVKWDVTVDAVNGVTNWLLRISDEDCRRRRPAGHERFAGAVEYYSREGAAHDPTLGPRLLITYA